ncbi:hypothetical protein [Arthrobacter castelli]|nr:hypothetical protein [Arthrobacter castelli]
MKHYLPHPIASTYACGADAVGRRHHGDTNPALTECHRCRDTEAWTASAI